MNINEFNKISALPKDNDPRSSTDLTYLPNNASSKEKLLKELRESEDRTPS